MKLKTARVFNYKCILDSGEVDIEDVTCLVGKNESGKSVFLEALNIFNPLNSENRSVFLKTNIPKNKITDEDCDVVSLVFELEKNEIEAIENKFGNGVLMSNKITIIKKYEDENFEYIIYANEKKVIDFLISQQENEERLLKLFNPYVKFSEVINFIDEIVTGTEETDEYHKDLKRILIIFKNAIEIFFEINEEEIKEKEDDEKEKEISKLITSSRLVEMIQDSIKVPKFFYFDEYSIMEGSISVDELKSFDEINGGQKNRGKETLVKLLKFSGLNFDLLQNPIDSEGAIDSEEDSLITSREKSSNRITEKILDKYWSQGKEGISAEIDTGNSKVSLRIKNLKDKMSVSFTERSRGFKWFFSFYAYFTQIEERNENVILLLDEPAHNLHAKAKGDFVEFLNEELGNKHQVIYTTHSPFLIPKNVWQTVRTVENFPKRGTKISSDSLKNTNDTLFPLQSALGYDITQNFFIANNCLLVEGVSDLLYIDIINDLLKERDRKSISEDWAITPVGGASKIATFVALLHASKLNIAILADSEIDKSQKIHKSVIQKNLIERKKVIFLDEYNDKKYADIEDLLGEIFYIKLINKTYDLNIKPENLRGTNGIINKITPSVVKKKGGSNKFFNHATPARYLMKHIKEFESDMNNEVLDKFEKIFTRVNDLLPSARKTIAAKKDSKKKPVDNPESSRVSEDSP